MTRHDLADGRTVVSRHITDRDWLAREPHLIEAEATALRLTKDSDVRAPFVIASEPEMGQLVMSFVPGAMLISSEQLHHHANELAAVARKIHEIELPTGHGLPNWRPWVAPDLEPPPWGDAGLWREAIDAYRACAEPIADPSVLLHRDFHPLNVLWVDEDATVVDWVNACVGHPHAELGHCRWNLSVLVDTDCADAFLRSYLSLGGIDHYDHFWDLAPLLSFLPGPMNGSGWRAVGRTDLTPDVITERTERFLRSVLVDKPSTHRPPSDR